jgi:hypothetical protein
MLLENAYIATVFAIILTGVPHTAFRGETQSAIHRPGTKRARYPQFEIA